MRAPDLHLASRVLRVQAQDLGTSNAFKLIPARWEQIDGVVRSPVMVCPKRKAFDEIIPSKAWGANRTSMIQTIRIVLACDDYNPHNFGGELPRVALVTPVPHAPSIQSRALAHAEIEAC